jgi:hypothetical protein
MRISYERKLFALAMTDLLFNADAIPQVAKQQAGLIMREIVGVLIRQQRVEQKLSQILSSSKKKKAEQINPIIQNIMFEENVSSDEE